MAYPSKNITEKHLEKSRKGGLAGKGKPKLREGKKCTDKCPAFSKGCPYALLSKQEHSGYCALVAVEGPRSGPLYEFITASDENLVNILARDLYRLEELVTDLNGGVKIWDRKVKLAELRMGKIDVEESIDMRMLFDSMGEHLKELELKHQESEKR